MVMPDYPIGDNQRKSDVNKSSDIIRKLRQDAHIVASRMVRVHLKYTDHDAHASIQGMGFELLSRNLIGDNSEMQLTDHERRLLSAAHDHIAIYWKDRA